MHGFCFIIGTDTLVFRPACERAVKKTLLLLHRSHTIPTMSAPEPAVDKADERTQMAFCSTTAQVVASAFGNQLLGGPENFAGNAVVDALTGRSSFSSFPVAKWNNKNLLHLYDDKNQPIHTLLGPHKFQLTPLTQVYAHMQAAALRLYPDHVLIVPKRSEKVLGNQLHSVRTWWDQDLRPKFDLAQVWSLHSPSTFTTPYSFRRALLGEPQETPTSELNSSKYPSLVFFKVTKATHNSSQCQRLTVAMSPEDILKFLLSSFARKGPFDQIFEAQEGAPANFGTAHSDQQRDADRMQLDTDSVKQECGSPEPPTYGAACALPGLPAASPASPRRAFARACVERMRELDENLRESVHLEDQHAGNFPQAYLAPKRRKLAIAVISSVSRVLCDGNKLLLDSLL